MGASNSNIKKNMVVKEGYPQTHAKPTTKDELDDLYLNESSICKIIYKQKEGKKGYGTGFFCEFNDNIPIKKVLFTNNHILNEESIEINKEIEFEYLKEKRIIKITEDRRKFTNEEYDYTCIEIFDNDEINQFFIIDKSYFDDINLLIDREIFILQYPKGGKLCNSIGKIINITTNNTIEPSAPTLPAHLAHH